MPVSRIFVILRLFIRQHKMILKNMIRLINFFQSIINELLILFLLVFLINNYIGSADQTIKADGIGYYDYLPSVFIHHDINRANLNMQATPENFTRLKSLGVYVNYKQSMVNKYPCGTAILEAPFFFAANLNADKVISTESGYQPQYHRFIYYSALFYLFLSILFLKKLLKLYDCKSSTIVFLQLLLVLGTSVTNYVNYDAAFSHVYSLFAITAFLYFVKAYFVSHESSDFLAAAIMLGLVILIRQVNGMVVFFIPFLAGSWQQLKDEFFVLFRKLPRTILGIIIVLVLISVQSYLWFLQTGEFFVYTYQGEGFNFSKPEIFNVLFSYQKGLFIYTPVLLFSAISLIWFIVKRRYYEVITWFMFFMFITYVISSWWCWYYGASYGMRVYIDYYPIFFILMAVMFDKLAIWVKFLYVIPSVFLIYLNVIQTYQYKEYILHWGEMDKEWYWTVFMKTEDKYKGILWKKQLMYEAYNETDVISLGNITMPKEKDSLIADFYSSDLKDISKVDVIQVRLTNDFTDENDARIALAIRDTLNNTVAYYHDRSLLHFNQKGLNSHQKGLFNFEMPKHLPESVYNIRLIASSHSNELKMNDVSINMYSKK